MKYMHSEWKGRLNHWLETLKQDFYLPLGEIPVEGFLTMEHLTPEEAAKGPFEPMARARSGATSTNTAGCTRRSRCGPRPRASGS